MLNVVNTLRPAQRDDYGVTELLEQVSKRSSLQDSEREEIGKIAGRVRTSIVNKPKPILVKQSILVDQQSTPSVTSSVTFRFWGLMKREGPESPTHSRHDKKDEWDQKGDVLNKNELLRGFGPVQKIQENSDGLMRGWGHSQRSDTDSTSGSEGFFEEDQNL